MKLKDFLNSKNYRKYFVNKNLNLILKLTKNESVQISSYNQMPRDINAIFECVKTGY